MGFDLGSKEVGSGRRILVVDNNSAQLPDLLSLLKKNGHGVEVIGLEELSGQAGHFERSPHVVILVENESVNDDQSVETIKRIGSHWPKPVVVIGKNEDPVRLEPAGLTLAPGRGSPAGRPAVIEAALASAFFFIDQKSDPPQNRKATGEPCKSATLTMTDIRNIERSAKNWQTRARCLKLLMEALPEGVAAFDPEGNIAKANSAFLKMYGFESKDQIPANPDNIPGREVDKTREVRKKIKSGISSVFETQRMTQKGELLDIQLKTGPLNDNAGFYEIHRDITEQKKVEQENRENEAKYRTLFEQSRDAIYITSPRGIPLAFNQATMDLFGFTGRDIADIEVAGLYVDPEERARNNALLEKQGYIKDCEVRLRRVDGSEILCLDTAAIWRDDSGQVKGYIGSLRDITQLRKTQEELKKAMEEAENATRAKSEFLANMSHEIRSPMNAILGLTHLALKTDLNEKQYDYLSKIKSSSNALLGIINDILDFSKIEAGRLRLESTEFNIEDVLGDLRNLSMVKAEEKGLELIFQISTETPRDLIGDPLRLGQILLNLTTNAIKFTTEGHVLIRVETGEGREEDSTDRIHVKFSVEDTGIGLNREQIDNLFQAFTQADSSTTRKFGGTGLGLAICKNLVELMDGRIKVESEPGKGSTFSFTAEFGLPSPKTDFREESEILKDLRVLIVDDNPVAREIVSESLESFSLITGQVSSGEEAIAELENAAGSGRPYQLVIMDWRLEGMDGIEASKRIKSSQDLAHIPSVLMVTAYGKGEVMEEARKAGIDAFLVKPVDRSLLLQTIVNLVARNRELEVKKAQAVDHETIDGLDNIRGAKILLAEDIEINQQVAVELLTDAGFEVTVADNGVILLEILNNTPPEVDYDVILMDIQMPEMDGYTAAGRIRNSNSRFKNIPIIAMTAYAMSDERKKCLDMGMNDHVAKPFDPAGLFSTLVKWIKPGTRQAVAPKSSHEAKKRKYKINKELTCLDVESGLSRVAGNETLYFDLLFKFHGKHRDINLEIEEAVRLYDWETAKKLTHMIKGMAGNLGARELYRAAGELETSIIKADCDLAGSRLEDFALHLHRVSSSIEGIIEENAEETPQIPAENDAIDMEEIRTLLNETAQLISTDYGRAIDLIDSLMEKLVHTPLQDDLNQVKSFVEEFSEEEALNQLDILGRKLEDFPGGR